MLPYLTALFVFFWQWNNKRRWRPVFRRRRLTRRSLTFLRRKMHPRENPGYAPDSGCPGLRIFWPRNGLVPLLRWRRHCQFGLQIVQSLTQLIIKYGMFFSSEFTARKYPNYGRVASAYFLSVRNGNEWTSAWSTAQSNSGVDVFALVWLRKVVISNSPCRTSYRKRYTVWPTAHSVCANNDFGKFSVILIGIFLVIRACSLDVGGHCVLARLRENC